jgi:hypothetical protein
MVYNKFLFAPPKYRVTRSRPESATRAATASLIFTSRESRALNKNYVNAFIWKPALQAGAHGSVRPQRDARPPALLHIELALARRLDQSCGRLPRSPRRSLHAPHAYFMPSADDKARLAAEAALDFGPDRDEPA